MTRKQAASTPRSPTQADLRTVSAAAGKGFLGG